MKINENEKEEKTPELYSNLLGSYVGLRGIMEKKCKEIFIFNMSICLQSLDRSYIHGYNSCIYGESVVC